MAFNVIECAKRRNLLKDNLKKLSLSRRAVHLGLMQLTRKPHVVLDRRLADCYRRGVKLSPRDKVPLKLPRSSPQDFVSVHKKRWQNKHQNNEKKSRSESRNLYISQKTDERTANDSIKLHASSSVKTTSSKIRTDVNKTYQTKIQEHSLPAKKSSTNIVQNPAQKIEAKRSYVNSSLTNDGNISAKTLATKEKLDSPAKNKSPSKPQICGQNSENKKFHSKNETISMKNRSINKEHSSSRSKLFETNTLIQVKKNYSKNDVDVSKNDKIFKKEHKQDEKIQNEKTGVNQKSSLPKINLLDLGIQERDCKSESNNISCKRNINVSGDTMTSNVRTSLGTETNDITSENQDASISNTHTSRIDSKLLSEQTHTSPTKIVKVDIHRGENIKTNFIDCQKDSPPIETNPKIAVKRRIYSESSESVLMKKMQKKTEASPDNSLDENLSNLKIDREIFSEAKFTHNNSESEKRIYWKIAKYIKRISKYSRKKRKLKRKRQNKSKRIRRKLRDWFGDCLSQSESNEELKLISECLKKKKLQFISDDSEMDDTFSDITTEEEMEDTYERNEISVHSCDVSVNHSQKDTENVISIKPESIDSSDSTIHIENDTLYNFMTKEEINEGTDSNSNKISIRKRNISVDILLSQKNVENTNPAKIRHTENSASVADAETVINKNDSERSENAVYIETEEVKQEMGKNEENIENINVENAETRKENMQDAQEIKNVNLVKEKISKDIKSNLELFMSAQKLMSKIEEKNDHDASQNIENISFKNNEDTSKTTTVITDHVSITSSKSEEDSSNKKDVNEIFASIANVSSKKSDKNTSDDHSSTDDNISDIEVEIKIKPKSKSRISRKFSLKTPLSAVNTCIKNLNTLKNNTNFLGELFQMNFNTSSENSRHGNTISEENEAKNTSKNSQDINQNVTAQIVSNTREHIYNFSHTTKDNANHYSKQQQERSSQDDTILDRNKSATQHHQEEKNKQIQSEQEKTRVIDENGSKSINSTCDASDLEKQLPKTSSSDKEKIIDEQQKNPQDNITSKGKDTTVQAEKNERVQFVAQKEARVAAENSVKSAKPARDMPDLTEQPRTSSDTADARRTSGVRVRTSAELGSSWTTIPMNLSTNLNTSVAPNSTVFPASSTSGSSLSYSSIKSTYHSPTANSSGAPKIGGCIENASSSFDIRKVITLVRNICLNVISCRNIAQEQIFVSQYCTKTNEKLMCEIKTNIIQIFQDIETLTTLLHVTNEDDVINFINQQKLIPLISTTELKHYMMLFQAYVSNFKYSAPFYDVRYCNQMPSNINNSPVSSASMTNVYAQTPFLGNAPNVPLPGSTPRMQHAQSSTRPSNINRSQSSRSRGNPLPSNQSLPNIRPKSSSVTKQTVSNPITNSIPNPTINPQQPARNASYAQNQYMPNMMNVMLNVNNPQQPVRNANYVQNQYMPNMMNVNNPQSFVNLGNNPYVSPLPSTSNINVHTYPSANQGNTNVSSTTGKMYSNVGTKTTTTATIGGTATSTINTLQQNQILYSQMPSYVISAPQLPTSMINQNTNEMYQIIYNVTQSKSHANINVPRNSANVTGNVTVGSGDRFVNPQAQTMSVSTEKSLPSSKNVSNNFASQSAHVQNVSLNPNQQQQNLLHKELPKNSSIILNLISTLSNNVSQNMQPSVLDKRTIPEMQTVDRVPNKTSLTKPQQNIHQGISPTNIISQESSNISSKIPVSQQPSILQNTMFNTASQSDKTISISPKTTPVPSSSNEIVNHCFNLSFLSELEKYMLLLNLQFYFERCSLQQQNFEEFQLERKMLVSLRKYLSHNINYITRENDEKLSKDISQKLAIIPNFQLEIKLPCNEIPCNKNNSICDTVQKNQSLEKNTDSNVSINSKSTAAKNDLSMEAQNRELEPKSVPKFPKKIKELLKKSPEIDLRKKKIDTPKMRFKRNLSSSMRKESENIKASLTRHSNISKENPITETSRKISETEAQNDAKINKIARSLPENSYEKQLSESCFSLTQDTSNLLRIALSDEINGCAKVAKNDAKKIDNIEVDRIFNISNVTLNNKGNDVISQCLFNSETQNNVTDKEAVKSSAEHLHNKRSESCSSSVQNTLNLLQYDETKDDNTNAKESENVETANICKISNVTVLNNNEKNEKVTSQISCNTEARDKELYHNEAYNSNNKIFGENSRDKSRDNVGNEKIEKSKSDFTEAQSDTSCIPRTSTPFVPNSTSELLLPMDKNESAKISQACKKFIFETFSSEFFLNAQQEDLTNEQINDSGKTYDESFESSGKLHIDENAGKSSQDLQEEQCDEISSSEKSILNTSKDLCFNETKSEPIETSLSPLTESIELKLLEEKETNVQDLNEKLKQQEMQTEETSSSKMLKDTSRVSSAVQSIDIVKQFEDMKENQVQMDTHSGVKAINELLKHVSDKYIGKPRTSSCNPISNANSKSDTISINVKETVTNKSDISNAIVANPLSKSDHENSDIGLNILNVSTISSSLFEEIDNSDVPFQNNPILNEMEEKELSFMNSENHHPEVAFVSLNEMKEEDSNVNENSKVFNSVPLNETKKETSPDVNDNPEVSDSTLLNEIKIEELLDVNNSKVPNSAISEMEEGMSLVADENLEALFALNEIKIEELDISDNSEFPDSASLNEMKEEKSSVVNHNWKVNNFVWLPEIMDEKSLNVNNNPEVSNFTSLNEIEERKSSDVSDIPEVSNYESLSKIKEEKSSDMDNISEELDEMENRPCLRCKRKSTVCCQACLEAHYCSKRCSDLHWKAIHYKQCKNLYKPIICVDL